MAKNGNLHAAKAAKNDEFYTRLEDIEAELKHYRQHFAGKTVLLNCGDAPHRNFWKYFTLNFERLGLKKLIGTSFTFEGHGSVCIYEGDKNGNRMPDENEFVRYELQGNGDFRSEECVELLKEADVVVGNPPFSLFREYVAQLMDHGKKFLIIGPQNAVTYKEIFPLIKNGDIWWGFNCVRWFKTEHQTAKSKITEDGTILTEGDRSRWFTNLGHDKRNIPIDLYKRYSNEEYPKYDNYDAIEVSKVADIPEDYDGVMGVPITFLDKYCPTQFEIVGTDSPYYIELLGIKRMGEEWIQAYRQHGGTGHLTSNMHSLCLYDKNGVPKSVYKRILIRRKHADK